MNHFACTHKLLEVAMISTTTEGDHEKKGAKQEVKIRAAEWRKIGDEQQSMKCLML